MRKITAPTNRMKVLVIFTNQVRAKLGGFGFIPQTISSGGNALKFYASMRLDMVRTGNKKNSKGELQYTTHKCTVKKNKLAPPARVAEFKIGKNGIINDIIKSDVI
jgi:recombination protein RecA